MSEHGESEASEAGGQRARPPLWKRLAASLVSTLVGLLLIELGLRAFWFNPYHSERPERAVLFRQHHAFIDRVHSRAAIDAEDSEVRYRTDEREYIVPSFRFDDPDKTIVFLGGSTTQNWAVKEELRFPALVSTLLEERGLRVNSLNGGESGKTLHDSLNRLINHVVLDRPDVVIVMHASNDFGLLRHAGSYRSRMGEELGLRSSVRGPLQLASARSSLVGFLRDWVTSRSHGNPTPDESPPPPPPPMSDETAQEFAKRLRAFAGVARGFGIEPVFMTQPSARGRSPLTPTWHDPEFQHRFNELIVKTGAEEDVFVIDLAKHVRDSVPDWTESGVVFYDSIHVNDHGSRIFAEYIAKQLLDSGLLDGG